jgi:hydroxyacylglutathione hydrolase
MFEVNPVAAFDDNYIWVVHDDRHAVAVDPGDAAALISFLDSHQLDLLAVLITHHHGDHTGGIAQLRQRYDCPIYGPDNPSIRGISHIVREGDKLDFAEVGLGLTVIATPGHTLDHISYVGDDYLFCGDTLFGCGCGKLFEGTPAMMAASLDKILALPDATRLCCAHEYTLDNIAFAKKKPSTATIPTCCPREASDRTLRMQHRPTLPSTLAMEKATNPFLRFHHPSMRPHAARYLGRQAVDDAEIFGAIRALKDRYDG